MSDTASRQHTDFAITGMTCASCAARIERKLNQLDGVSATVNLALETARVEHPESVSAAEVASVVERLGYHAAPSRPRGLGSPASPSAELSPTTGQPTAHDHAGAEQGQTAPHDHSDAPRLRARLIVATILTVPTVALGMVPAWQFPGWAWLSLVLATPVVGWAGWPFHRATVINLRHGATTMDTLVSLGTLAAYLWSVVALVFGSAGRADMSETFVFRLSRDGSIANVYFEAATAVTTFLLAGRFLESRAKGKAGAALRALSSLGAKDVAVLRDGRESRIPVDELRVGDRFLVRPGEKIATDGVVVDGAAAVDTSMVTGESIPVEIATDDPVVGGTVNTDGRLVVRATRVGADTQLARMAELVAAAQTGKAQVQRLADRISGIFVPIVLGIALVTFAVWLLSGAAAAAAFTAAVAVLIVACPCALGLATPTALLVGTGRAAQLGILISGPQALESARHIDTVVLDKTGTVTTGRLAVAAVHPRGRYAATELIALAGAAESGSEHPIGRAIAEAAVASAPLRAAADFRAQPGFGVRASVDGRPVTVGRADLPTDGHPGRTAVRVAVGDEPIGVIELADQVRPDSARAINRLRALGLTPHLLTGDHQGVAAAVAAEVGIDPANVHAGVLPEQKVAVVAGLQRAGHRVAMVGDGINDAAALATADLGMAMGAGTDAAIAAADLTLVRADLSAAVDGIGLARRTLRVIKGNLFWAFAYNVAGIPLAALGLLNPMIAGAAMAFSSLFVVTNSLRLRGFRAGTEIR